MDVNVHPAKTEVKFSEERRVFSLVYQAVTAALQQENRLEPPPEPVAAEPELPAQVPPAALPAGPVAAVPPVRPKGAEIYPGRQAFRTPDAPGGREPLPVPGKPAEQEKEQPAQQSLFAAPVSEYRMTKPPEEPRPTGEAARTGNRPSAPDHKILGEAFKTYLLVEQGEKLILIDKHAAHERMNFDRLKARQQPAAAQELLLPQPLRLNGEDLSLLEEPGALFEEFGFRIERFGDTTVILRAVPQDILPEDALPALEEILEHLRAGGSPDPAAARDEILHTVSCKAAIKAGWNTSLSELERIAEEVLSGRVRYCPHGRPVSVVMTREDLDKLFLRIVS